MNTDALAAVASLTSRVALDIKSLIIIIILSLEVVVVVVSTVRLVGPGYAWLDNDMLVVVDWEVGETRCNEEVGDGAAEGVDADFAGNLDEDVRVPGRRLDKIADRKRHVSVVVDVVLGEDDVSPRAIEISGRHGRERIESEVWVQTAVQ